MLIWACIRVKFRLGSRNSSKMILNIENISNLYVVHSTIFRMTQMSCLLAGECGNIEGV